MAKKGLLLSIVLFLTSTSLYSESSYKSTKQAMNEIFSSFVALIPYAANEMRFNDPNAEAFIKAKLLNLKTAFKNAKHLKQIKAPGFQPSFEVVTDHLEQTYENFSTRNKAFARTRLKATAEMCISCHSQLPKGKSHTFRNFRAVTRKDFFNDYEYGDYLFLIRDYTQATRFYEREISARIAKNKALKAIHNSKTTNYLDFTIEKSLKRVLTIYTKVFYKPEKALAFFDKYKNEKDLPSGIKEDLGEWIEDLAKWKKSKFSGDVANEKEFGVFIKNHLDESENDKPSHVDFLIGSGVIYRYINKNSKSPVVPRALYWLGKIDYELEHSYFYSLAEVYLKNCVKQYPTSPFAKKCFNQYKNNLEMGFTGTSGTNIPEDEMKILEDLKARLK